MNQENLLTPEQVAKRLNVSVISIKRWLRSGKLEGVKVGNKIWRIEPDALQRFIENHKTSKK